MIVALAVMAVLIFGGVSIWVVVSDDGPAVSAAGSESPKPQRPGAGNSPFTGASPSPSGSPPTTVAPKVPGWQGVASATYQMAYDAPASWKVNDPGTSIGFAEDAAGIYVIMHSSSEFLKGFCPARKALSRAAVGFTGDNDADPLGTVATNAARQWAIGR
jgi:hypothetical protein